MTSTSDRAELSTLRAQVQDLLERITPLAERYGDSPDSVIASDLFAGERALLSARRALDQAISHLEDDA